MQIISRHEPIAPPLSREKGISYGAAIGKGNSRLIGLLSTMRIRYFRSYPHLYDGSSDNEYEKQCAEELSRSDQTIFVTAHFDDAVVGIATAFPLVSAAEILDGKETTFLQSRYCPTDLYYFSEIIVAPTFRGSGIGRCLYNRVERQALTWGYSYMCLATIARDHNDPRRPRDYQKSPYLWPRLGFRLTDIRFSYHWPTLMANGSTRYVPNTMALWIKDKL